MYVFSKAALYEVRPHLTDLKPWLISEVLQRKPQEQCQVVNNIFVQTAK